MNKADIRNKAMEVIFNIKNRFIIPGGLLSRSYPVTNRTIFDNFDDIVPFFIYFGEEDFLLHQIYLIQKKGDNYWLKLLTNKNGLLIIRSIDEFFGGIYELWKKTKNKVVFDLLSNAVNYIDNNIMINNYLTAGYDTKINKGARYYEPWSSGLLETFCEMRANFPKMFEKSKEVFNNWLIDDYFLEYSIFPYRSYESFFLHIFQKKFLSYFKPNIFNSKPIIISPFNSSNSVSKNIRKQIKFYLNNVWYSQLMKSNSTCAFTLLEFYRVTQDKKWMISLENWLESATNQFCDGQGRVYNVYLPTKRLKLEPGIAPAFILIDIICDAAYFTNIKDSYLDLAGKIINFYLSNKLPNGLIPHSADGLYAHIDSQVDFSISMRRYAEITGNKRYLNDSKELMIKTLEEFYTPKGYLNYAGNGINNYIDPKYNALLLKGIINLLTIEEKIYPNYHSLFKDR